MAVKRKASPVSLSATPPKAARKTNQPFDHSRPEERYGIVQRKYYPPQMADERCQQYNGGYLPRPIELLAKTLDDTETARNNVKPGSSIVHWFKRDLRLRDNKALSLASAKAKEHGIPLICLFIVSPQDYEAHLTSAARVDFELRTLEIMKQDLDELDIPLYVETVELRRNVKSRILELCREWGSKHLYCNIEYEVDELRREAALTSACLKEGVSLTAVHDDVIVPPGDLSTGAGRQFSVYSPWFRAWVTHLHSHKRLLEEHPAPTSNPVTSRQTFADIFETPIPSAPANKSLDTEHKERLSSLWPAGEHEAMDRLDKFLAQKIEKYKSTRNFPAANSTASLSVHFSAGTLAARTAVRYTREANSTQKLDGGKDGIKGWISEIAWRDFYIHVLAHWPYVCMNKPFKYEYTHIEWEYNDDHFDKWCKGQTGFPVVDAAMRQMAYMGYMHNRCRMIVASFLAKDLLLDWRMGEKFFMESLVDGSFASNNGGRGFSASTGVDPQPYFRIFNPLLQSEKFDDQGDYIRKWVPELRDVQGKAVHDPYNRGAAKIVEQNGYPRPIVDHKERRALALKRHKEGLGRDTA